MMEFSSGAPLHTGIVLDDGTPVYGVPELDPGMHECTLDKEPATVFTWKHEGVQTGFLLKKSDEAALKRRMMQYTSGIRGISIV